MWVGYCSVWAQMANSHGRNLNWRLLIGIRAMHQRNLSSGSPRPLGFVLCSRIRKQATQKTYKSRRMRSCKLVAVVSPCSAYLDRRNPAITRLINLFCDCLKTPARFGLLRSPTSEQTTLLLIYGTGSLRQQNTVVFMENNFRYMHVYAKLQ